MRTLIGVGERRDGLYYFHDFPRVGALNIDGVFSSYWWHQRLGHPSYKVIRSLPFLVKSFSFSRIACDICHQAKQTRDKFPISDSKATKCFEIIHCDLWGKYHTPFSCGATYFLTLVDDYSRAVWVYLLFDKTDIYKMFSSFFPMIKRQFDAKVKVVRSDNGTKFNCMRDYFQHNGILFQTSVLIHLNKMDELNVNIITF